MIDRFLKLGREGVAWIYDDCVDIFWSYIVPTVGIAIAIYGAYLEGGARDFYALSSNIALFFSAIYAKHPVLMRLEILCLISSIINALSHFLPLEQFRVPCAAIGPVIGVLWLQRTRLLNALSLMSILGFSILMLGWALGATTMGAVGFTVGSLVLAAYAAIDFFINKKFVAFYWIILNGWFAIAGGYQVLNGVP